MNPTQMSLEQVCANARPGDTINLEAGLYAPATFQGLKGTAENPITVRGPKAPPIAFEHLSALDINVYVVEIRNAFKAGQFSLENTDGLAVVDGTGHETALALLDCQHVHLENLVLREARTNLMMRRCENLTVRDCVLTGQPPKSVVGAQLFRETMEEAPNQTIRFERVAAYGMKENGFGVSAGAAFDVQWNCCLAHSMESDGGDGFSFSHVTPTDPPRGCRVFADGIDYNFHLLRCVALNNRLDGFDLGQGVGGVTLEYCLGDGNGHGAYYAKDIKVWSSNNNLLSTRMTGRILFVKGVNRLEDFKTGVKEPEAQS
jgi:hypothetical protein